MEVDRGEASPRHTSGVVGSPFIQAEVLSSRTRLRVTFSESLENCSNLLQDHPNALGS